MLRKPDWIRVKAGSPTTRFYEIKEHPARAQIALPVCEEASCPNIGECFGKRHGHLHDHGRQMHAPLPVLRRRATAAPTRWTPDEPLNLAQNHCCAEAEIRR